jgi:hypothetical protein
MRIRTPQLVFSEFDSELPLSTNSERPENVEATRHD